MQPYENECSFMATVTSEAKVKHFADCSKIGFRAELSRRNRTLKLSVEYRTTAARSEALVASLVPGTVVQIKGELWYESIGEGQGAKRFLLLVARSVQRLSLESKQPERPHEAPRPSPALPSFFGNSLPS